VLITNIGMWPPSGTVLYVRDLALELKRQGHLPSVFSSTTGDMVDDLRGAGIEVTDNLRGIRTTPDIIHGHHHAPTLVALQRWPTVPAIFVCHDHTSPYDRAPIHPRIHRYFGVSGVCVQRLIRDGAPEHLTALLLNFVDIVRFKPRAPLPERPRRALVFSNYAHEGSHLPAAVEACREAGLELDVVGMGVGRVVLQPEQLLGEYDIVFAKAKAAMEAMAVGTAVILCDYSGVGPMVTSARFDELRPLNFGFAALRGPLRRERLLREIARYDAEDAAAVRDLIRSSAGLAPAVSRLVGTYREVIAVAESTEWRSRAPKRSFRTPLFLRVYWAWQPKSPRLRAMLKALPGVDLLIRGLRRLLRETGQ
jgi:glycosyltransferase involved in cell wall biosynthesis